MSANEKPEGGPALCHQLVVGLNIRADSSSLDVGLDLEAPSQRLVVVAPSTGFDVCFDLHSASHRLVVVIVHATSLDGRFDFHTCSTPFGC